MLKRIAPLFLLGILMLLVGSLAMTRIVAARTPAAAVQQAQDKPTITLFSTSLKGVDRTVLTNRTARVPVSWTTANRPTDANLVFEQVLPSVAHSTIYGMPLESRPQIGMHPGKVWTRHLLTICIPQAGVMRGKVAADGDYRSIVLRIGNCLYNREKTVG